MPQVATEDLVDAQGVADILGLAHRNTVSQYQRMYSDMPRPVLDLGQRKVKLWLRPEIESWASSRLRPGEHAASAVHSGRAWQAELRSAVTTKVFILPSDSPQPSVHPRPIR